MAVERFKREELKTAPDTASVYSHVVRVQDVDAAGIVFFARIIALFNDALFDLCESHGCPLQDLIANGQILPLRHTETDFLAPLKLGDRYRVQLVRYDLRETDVVLGYRLTVEGSDRIHALGQFHHVSVELPDLERRPVPAKFVETLARICPDGRGSC